MTTRRLLPRSAIEYGLALVPWKREPFFRDPPLATTLSPILDLDGHRILAFEFHGPQVAHGILLDCFRLLQDLLEVRLPLRSVEATIVLPICRGHDCRGEGLPSSFRRGVTLHAALLASHMLPQLVPSAFLAPLRSLLLGGCRQSTPRCSELIGPRTVAASRSPVRARPGGLPVALTDLCSLHSILEICPLSTADGGAMRTALLAAGIGATRSGRVPAVACGSCLLLKHVFSI